MKFITLWLTVCWVVSSFAAKNSGIVFSPVTPENLLFFPDQDFEQSPTFIYEIINTNETEEFLKVTGDIPGATILLGPNRGGGEVINLGDQTIVPADSSLYLKILYKSPQRNPKNPFLVVSFSTNQQFDIAPRLRSSSLPLEITNPSFVSIPKFKQGYLRDVDIPKMTWKIRNTFGQKIIIKPVFASEKHPQRELPGRYAYQDQDAVLSLRKDAAVKDVLQPGEELFLDLSLLYVYLEQQNYQFTVDLLVSSDNGITFQKWTTLTGLFITKISPNDQWEDLTISGVDPKLIAPWWSDTNPESFVHMDEFLPAHHIGITNNGDSPLEGIHFELPEHIAMDCYLELVKVSCFEERTLLPGERLIAEASIHKSELLIMPVEDRQRPIGAKQSIRLVHPEWGSRTITLPYLIDHSL